MANRARLVGIALLLTASAATASSSAAVEVRQSDGSGGDESREIAEREYEALRELHFGPWVEVPEGHLIFEFEGATWRFEQGRFALQRPLESGAIVGIAFEGRGRFDMQVPDHYELEQLRRFSRDEELEGLDVEFDRLFLRVADPGLVRQLRDIAGERNVDDGPFTAAPWWVRQRVQGWILEEQHDSDSRLLAALSTFGERYLRTAMRIEEHGWTTFTFDARQREEIELLHHTRANVMFAPNFGESWLRMDQLSDREGDGSAGSREGGFSRLLHFDAEVDLRTLGKEPARGFGDNHPLEARLSVAATFRSSRNGLGALVLQIDPRATIEAVTTSQGRQLPVLRYPRGTLAGHLDSEWGNREFVVLLEEPLVEGEEVTLDFDYSLELVNFAPGLTWHPNTTDFELHPFTASLELTTRDYYDVLATGERVGWEERGDSRWSRWEVPEPSRIVGFTFARYPHAERFEWEDAPQVPPLTIFATTGGYLSATRIANLERFFGANLRCLVDLLGPPEAEELIVTLITASHSQSFEGFLQVSESIARKGNFGQGVHGTKELHAAHEIAHQWFGHLVQPDTYRDVWLSEALAEYTAGLCVRQTADDGDKVFENMIEAFRNEVVGSTAAAFNPFARAGLASRNRFERDRMPPIAHGARAAVRHNPFAVASTVYRKGALVLHMVDELLRVETGSREVFVELLRGLIEKGRSARLRTSDLEAELAKVSSLDWKLLFDQWVRLAEVPSWKVASKIEPGGGVRLVVEQGDVVPEFKSWVPVRVELRDGSEVERLVEIQGERTSLQLDFEQPVVAFHFNENGAVPTHRLRGRPQVAAGGGFE